MRTQERAANNRVTTLLPAYLLSPPYFMTMTTMLVSMRYDGSSGALQTVLWTRFFGDSTGIGCTSLRDAGRLDGNSDALFEARRR
jgi:hypothetical protein